MTLPEAEPGSVSQPEIAQESLAPLPEGQQETPMDLEAILAQAESAVAMVQQQESLDDKVVRARREDQEKRYAEAKEAYGKKNREHKRAGKELGGEMVYNYFEGDGASKTEAVRDLLKHRRAYYTEVGQFEPDVALGTDRGQEVKTFQQNEAKKFDAKLNTPTEPTKETQDEFYFVGQAVNAQPFASGEYVPIDRPARRAHDYVDALEEKRMHAVNMGMEIEWWNAPDGTLQHGKLEELRKYPEEYNRIRARHEETVDEMYGTRDAALGVGLAALEEDDFDTAVYAFEKSEQLNNPAVLKTLSRKVQDLIARKDSRLAVFAEQLKSARQQTR